VTWHDIEPAGEAKWDIIDFFSGQQIRD